MGLLCAASGSLGAAAGPGTRPREGHASPIGVIVSHVIVLSDFIEEMQQKGERFGQAVLDG